MSARLSSSALLEIDPETAPGDLALTPARARLAHGLGSPPPSSGGKSPDDIFIFLDIFFFLEGVLWNDRPLCYGCAWGSEVSLVTKSGNI